MSVINRQVKHIVIGAPYYLWDNLIVNNCTESGVFNILRIEVIVAGQVRYLDLITDTDTKRFLGLGQCSDKTTGFSISINMCKTYSIVAYMEDAS